MTRLRRILLAAAAIAATAAAVAGVRRRRRPEAPRPTAPAAPAPIAAPSGDGHGAPASAPTVHGAGEAADVVAEPVRPDDATLVEAVRRRFAAADVDTSQVEVGCEDGVVSLRGQVGSLGEQGVLETEASGVDGVREVQSWLHEPVTEPPAEPARIDATNPPPLDAG